VKNTEERWKRQDWKTRNQISRGWKKQDHRLLNAKWTSISIVILIVIALLFLVNSVFSVGMAFYLHFVFYLILYISALVANKRVHNVRVRKHLSQAKKLLINITEC